MLVLSRKPSESIVIRDDIVITILETGSVGSMGRSGVVR
jgi:sRNA-binding carbon storage regulator CsrA